MILALLLCTSLQSIAHADSLPTKTITYAGPARTALLDYCCVTDVPCSIEVDDRKGDLFESQYLADTESYMRRPADEVLKKLMQRYHGHDWSFKNGVLSITPKQSVVDNPIDRRLGRFDYRAARIDYIFSDILKRAGKSDSNILGFPRSTPPSHPLALRKHVSYSASNPSMREALDALIREYGHAAWFVVYRNSSSDNGRIVAQAELRTYDNAMCSLETQNINIGPGKR